MRYSDASLLLSLCDDEPDTVVARRLVAAGIVTWSASAVEIASAVVHRRREDARLRTAAEREGFTVLPAP